MIDNYKSLNNFSIKINDSPILKIENSTPKLPTIKKFFPEISKTPLNDKNETNNSSNIIQKKFDNKITQSSFNSPKNVKDYHSHKNIKKKKI